MLIAKCSLCKIKTTLQACEICEEAKCNKCAQQHLTNYHAELKRKWLAFEIKFQHIKQQTETRRNLLIDLQKTADEQLNCFSEEYPNKFLKLNQEYNEFSQKLNLSKTQCNNELNQLESQLNKLQSDTLFQKWTAINDSSRYIIQDDTSNIENLLTEIETYLSEENNVNCIEYTFIPDANITLKKPNLHKEIMNNNAYTTRKQYYTQLTSIPHHIIDINILPRFICVYQSFIYICDPTGRIAKYEYLSAIKLNFIQFINLKNTKPFYTVSCFAINKNYFLICEKNSDNIMIHNHRGTLEKKIKLSYQPKFLLTSFDDDYIWICNDMKKVCISFSLNNDCNLQELELIQYDDVQPVRMIRTNNRFLIQDVRSSNSETPEPTEDNLLIYNSLKPNKNPSDSISLDFIKYESDLKTARLYHPILDNEGFLIIKYISDDNDKTRDEIVIIDTNNPKEPVIVNRIKLNCMFGMDFTIDNRLILGYAPYGEPRKIFIF